MRTLDPEMETLLRQRVEERYRQGRLKEIYTIGPGGVAQKYTPEQILDEIQKGTSKGEEFLLAEKKLMDELKKRL